MDDKGNSYMFKGQTIIIKKHILNKWVNIQFIYFIFSGLENNFFI